VTWIKVATFNANSIRARLPIILSWLREEKPHLLSIQETKVQDQAFPVQEFEALGYYAVHKGQKSYNGVAILSTSPLESISYQMEDAEKPDEARFLQGSFHGISLVNTYLPQGKSVDHIDFHYKLRWFERLLVHFECHFDPEEPLLWMGDLNVALDEQDVYDPKRLDGHVCFHPQEREALRRIMQWGLVDLFRMHHPNERAFSFWDYRIPKAQERDLGWRLDYIFATPPLAKNLISCRIDKTPRTQHRPSDHTFVVAEFNLG